MCTRILNNIDLNHVTVGRNFDWKYSLPGFIYRFNRGLRNQGINRKTAETLKIASSAILEWEVTYPSIATLVGDDINGFSTSDGINSQGLTVNALFDTGADYGAINPLTSDDKVLSVLRWAQFVLDCFADVSAVNDYFTTANIRLIGESVPGAPESQARLHLAISDQQGHSLIIEVNDGVMVLHNHISYTVVTNQPSYSTQLQMLDYWLFQWNKFPESNSSPLYTAPGGCSPSQRFERAAFYRYMQPETNNVNKIAQVRSMIMTCSTPLLCELNEKTVPYTLWSNLSDSKNQTYYFQSSEEFSLVWFNFMEQKEICERVKVAGQGIEPDLFNLSNKKLKPCFNPFLN